MGQKKVELFLNYDWQNSAHPQRKEFTSGYLLEQALSKYFDITHDDYGADFVINMTPYLFNRPFVKKKITFVYDNAETYHLQADWVYYSTEKKSPLPNSSLMLDAIIPEYKYYPCEFEYDIGFLGRQLVKERLDVVEKLGEKFKVLNNSIELGEPSARLLSKAKLLLIIDDYRELKNPIDWIDRRIYTFGNIRPVLVPFNKDYLIVGKPHVHYIPYNDHEDLIKQATYYLSHMDKAEKIGDNLKKELLNNTYAHRAKEIYKKYLTYA